MTIEMCALLFLFALYEYKKETSTKMYTPF